jgi:hypothetical protein
MHVERHLERLAEEINKITQVRLDDILTQTGKRTHVEVAEERRALIQALSIRIHAAVLDLLIPPNVVFEIGRVAKLFIAVAAINVTPRGKMKDPRAAAEQRCRVLFRLYAEALRKPHV